MLELVDALKSKNMFDDTVIQVMQEFNRAPKTSGAGSDHGISGQSCTYFSGAIKKPFISGNICVNGQSRYDSSGYITGTWGMASLVTHASEGRKNLNIGNAISTTAALLRVPSPLANFAPVFFEQGGELKSLVGEPENV